MLNLKKITALPHIVFMLLALIAAVLSLDGVDVLGKQKLRSFDFLTRLHYSVFKAGKENPYIATVTIDDDSLEKIGKQWPWERRIFAKIVDELGRYRPKIIAFDLTFAGKSPVSENDILLAGAVKRSRKVILASYFNRTKEGAAREYIKPTERLMEAALDTGFVNIPRWSDLKIRQIYLFEDTNNDRYFHFALKIASHFASRKPREFRDDKIKEVRNKARKDDPVFFKFEGTENNFLNIPVWELLQGTKALKKLENRIVIIGHNSEVFKDNYDTPLGLLPGPVIQANAVMAVLKDGFISSANGLVLLLVTALLLSLSFYINWKMDIQYSLLLHFSLSILMMGLSFLLFIYNIWLDFIVPIACIVLNMFLVSAYRYIVTAIENRNLKKISITDHLTGLYTLRYFQHVLGNEFVRARAYSIDLSLIVFDIDHFKSVNDTHGHDNGNVVIKSVADAISNNIRKTDLPFRYGGDEFCIILTNTGIDGALKVAENIKKTVDATLFTFPSGTMSVHLSMGIASISKSQAKDQDSLFKAADNALYKAKESGRNRIVF